MFKWLKKLIPKKESNIDNAHSHALLAIAYYRRAQKEDPDVPGIWYKVDGTSNQAIIQ